MFTTHYADLFYSAKEAERPLRFPETPMPVFWDFAYFSFTIAAACQTADVTTLNAGVRKARDCARRDLVSVQRLDSRICNQCHRRPDRRQLNRLSA